MPAGIRTATLPALMICACLAGSISFVAASESSGAAARIQLPSGDDDYAKLVSRAAAQDGSVDFAALRLAYLTSEARKQASDPRALREKLFAAANANDDQRMVDAAVELLSSDYIDMYGHKLLRQACAQLHDDACAAQGKFVEFGLLRSITDKGDGKSCETGWPVVTIDEEYFMLDMIGAHLRRQSLAPPCDVMDTTDDQGQDTTYYFRIEAVLKDEESMLAH